MGTMEISYIKKGKINQYVERYRATNQNGQSDNKTKRETLKKKKEKTSAEVSSSLERVECTAFWDTALHTLYLHTILQIL